MTESQAIGGIASHAADISRWIGQPSIVTLYGAPNMWQTNLIETYYAQNFGKSIYANFPEMEAAAGRVQQAADEFRQLAEKVLQAAQQLGQSWEGDSQAAFMQEQQEANAWYQQMAAIAGAYVSALRSTVSKYREVDEQIAASIRAK